jgi:MoxR-like ATPase
LLEAMQERHVTAGGERHDLAPPFFVLATQNPIEQEGTYPLPEAQQDRFLFKIFIGYPGYEEEYAIAERTTGYQEQKINMVLAGADILRHQRLVRQIPAAPDVIRHALDLVRASRPTEPDAPDFAKKLVTWGAGPRAVQSLLLGGKARAALRGREFVSVDDVRAMAHPVMRHRIVTNFSAEAEGYSSDRVIDKLLEAVQPYSTHLDSNERINKVLST